MGGGGGDVNRLTDHACTFKLPIVHSHILTKQVVCWKRNKISKTLIPTLVSPSSSSASGSYRSADTTKESTYTKQMKLCTLQTLTLGVQLK